MKLSTRFNKNVATVGNLHDVLDEGTLRRVTPSVFALDAHASRSDRYLFIPTFDIVKGLENEGFKPVFAAQAKPRDVTKHGHTKHFLRFRRESDINGPDAKNGVPEICLLNSHGGESQLQLFGGVFRFICLNSCVWGDTFDEVKVRHTGKLVDEAIEGAYKVVERFGKAKETIAEWREIDLSRDEQRLLAQSAAQLRLPAPVEGEPQTIVDVEQFDTVRRPEDNRSDLWTSFNRVQENVMRGGQEGVRRSVNGQRRRTTVRPVNGIDSNVALNRALWTLSEGMAKLKQAA